MKLTTASSQITVLTVGVPKEVDEQKLCAEIYRIIPDGYPMPRLKDGISVSADALFELFDSSGILDNKLIEFFQAVFAHQPQPDEFVFITE